MCLGHPLPLHIGASGLTEHLATAFSPSGAGGYISTGLGPGEIGKIIIRRQGRRLPAKSGSDITASMVPALFTYLFGRKFKKFSHFFENFSD